MRSAPCRTFRHGRFLSGPDSCWNLPEIAPRLDDKDNAVFHLRGRPDSGARPGEMSGIGSVKNPYNHGKSIRVSDVIGKEILDLYLQFTFINDCKLS